MWPNSQEIADLAHLLKKFLMENFIFVQCAFFLYFAKNCSFFKKPSEDDLNILIDTNDRLTNGN